jgi:hypothetical protein
MKSILFIKSDLSKNVMLIAVITLQNIMAVFNLTNIL